MDITVVDIYIGLALNGIFTGLGSALGSYIATNHLIGNSKKLFSKIRNIKHKKRK